MDLLNWAPELIPLLIFGVSFHHEPRRFRTGLYLFFALSWLLVVVFGRGVDAATDIWNDLSAGYLVLGLIAVAALTVIGLAVFLIAAGITLVVKEGFNIRRLLSAGLGLGMLAFTGALAFAILTSNGGVMVWLVLLGLPVGYLGTGFAAFVLYGSFYPAWMARYAPLPDVVVVLGSGLIQGRVPPLLADRLRHGRRVLDRALAAGRGTKLITSGGRGPDEPIAEGVAMRDFLLAEGVPADKVLVEDRSRNTEQNLDFTAELMKADGISGLTAVVTSDFHALRAAFRMRVAGVDGYALGARTARYFWPTAVIREYLAVLRDHRRLNLAMVFLVCVPLGIAVVSIFAAWVS